MQESGARMRALDGLFLVKNGHDNQAKRRAADHREESPDNTGAPQRPRNLADRDGANKPNGNSKRANHGSTSEGLKVRRASRDGSALFFN
jgi:hypothetical protein